MPFLIETSRSHLHPGASGRFAGAGRNGIVAFANGARTTARLDDAILSVDPHRTAAGTRIGAKRWRVESPQDGGFKFAGRA